MHMLEIAIPKSLNNEVVNGLAVGDIENRRLPVGGKKD